MLLSFCWQWHFLIHRYSLFFFTQIRDTQRQDPDGFALILEKLKAQLTAQDVAILGKIVPALKGLLGYSVPEEEVPVEGQEGRNRLHYVFRLFVRTISELFVPLVIMLDDAQWSDASSLDLMQLLMTDPETKNLLVIGLYRSNEVDAPGFENHLLTTVMNDLRTKDTLAITEVEVGNLEPDAVQSVVQEVLQTENNDKEKVQVLSEICHKRTQGNAFFLISFLSMLEEERLLEYNAEESQFQWDNEIVKARTSATSNIVDMVKDKMSKLPQELCRVLSMAACLGSSFERSRLELVWSNLGPEDDEECSILMRQLSLAVKEGFLDVLDAEDSNFRFVHDKVQESAFALIPEGETSDFKFQIGKILRMRMNDKEKRSNIFLLANLLKESPKVPMSVTEQVELAEMNLEATQQALGCSAFSSAATYADKGIECLPMGSWESHYALTLDLYSSAAEAHEITGNHDRMRECCDEVIAVKCDVVDKQRVYTALTLQIANSGKHMEAVNILLEVLEELGISFPKTSTGRAIATLMGLIKCKMGVKRRTHEEVKNLPILHDRRKAEAMRMCDRLAQYTYLAGSDLAGLALLKNTELTLQWGVSSFSSPAFAALSILLVGK